MTRGAETKDVRQTSDRGQLKYSVATVFPDSHLVGEHQRQYGLVRVAGSGDGDELVFAVGVWPEGRSSAGAT